MQRAKEADGASKTGMFLEPNRSEGTFGTKVTAEWLNTVQNELATVIEGRFGVGSLRDNDSTQLYKAIIDILEFGNKAIPIDVENGATKKPLPLKFDSNDCIAATFFSLSNRRVAGQQPMMWGTEHFVAYNRFSKSWTILESKGGNTEYTPNKLHSIDIDTNGQLLYSAGQITGKDHEGTLYISNIRKVRI